MLRMRRRRTLSWLIVLVALSGHLSGTFTHANCPPSRGIDDGAGTPPADSADPVHFQEVAAVGISLGYQPTALILAFGDTYNALRWDRGRARIAARLNTASRTLRTQSVLLQI
jgi:hypothetical protein